MPASFWFSLQSELRVVVRQNPRCSHIKLKGSQVGIFLDLIDELVGERGGVRFPIHGNLTWWLIIDGDAHGCGGKSFQEMLQSCDRRAVQINRLSDWPPF